MRLLSVAPSRRILRKNVPFFDFKYQDFLVGNIAITDCC